MDKNGEFKNNLITLFKLFKNRPQHLARYLIDNSAFNKDFISRILNSDNLTNDSVDISAMHFSDISKMDDYYNSIIDTKLNDKKSITQITEELNKKLNDLIIAERFEEAANLRDYMLVKKIKRKKNIGNK